MSDWQMLREWEAGGSRRREVCSRGNGGRKKRGIKKEESYILDNQSFNSLLLVCL